MGRGEEKELDGEEEEEGEEAARCGGKEVFC